MHPKKLYIETVGCQMNVLDSELVVGSLRRQGYELTDDAARRRRRSSSTPAASAQHAEDKIYSALGRLRARTSSSTRDKVIGVLGCMAQKDQELIRQRAPVRRPRLSAPGQLAPAAGADRRGRSGTGSRRCAVSLGRTDGGARRGRAQLRELRPAARPVDAADAVPGVRPHHDRLRQVLHLLHRAERPRPGAEPAARAHRRRGPAARRPRAARRSRSSARRSTATSYARATAARRGCRDLLDATARHRRHRAASSSSRTSQGHDRRPARRRPRPAEGAARTCTCRRSRGCDDVLQADEAAATRSSDYREMLARCRETVPGVAVTQRLHRRLLRRDGGSRSSRPCDLVARVPVQEQLHLQVQPAARHEGRTSCTPTTCRRRSSGGGTTTCWPCRTRSARRTTEPFVGREVEVLVEGPSKRQARGLHQVGESLSGHEATANSFPGSAWERAAPEALPRAVEGARQSLARRAFPGRAWARVKSSSSPAARRATGSWSSTARRGRSAKSCRSASTMPTPSRCSARS